MKSLYKKAIAVLILIPFINLGFLIFAQNVYFNIDTLIVLLLFTFILSLDIIMRPISEKKDQFKYPILSLLLFLFLPFLAYLPYLENILFIRTNFPIWNNFIIYIIGFCALLLGGIILFYSRRILGKFATSKIVIEHDHHLITKGLYKYIRHPIYLGMLLIFFGYGLSFKSIISTFFSVLILFGVFNNRMNLEEKMLISELGKDYEEYMQQTKRLIPYIY